MLGLALAASAAYAADGDGDGVPDAADNCMTVYNDDQLHRLGRLRQCL